MQKNLILIFTLFISCAGQQRTFSFFEDFKPVKIQIRPGETTYFELKTGEEFPGELICRNKINALFFDRDRYRIFLSESYFSSLKPYPCKWKTAGREFIVAHVNVLKKSFPSERLKVDKKKVIFSPEDLKRIKKERVFKNKVYSSSASEPLFQGIFELPLHSKVTSIYGSRRIFNNQKKTQHLGTDFRAAVGTPIQASNSGRVVIARDLFFSGKTVVIDHGLGIFTIYGHLSKLNVQEGELLARAQVLGLSGKTGRVTGPHLHWGIIINGMAIEGSSLIETMKKAGDWELDSP